MESETILAVRRLNRSFYEQRAASFDRTRTCPWRAWQHLPPLLEPLLGPRWRGLEVGCGNGRFASFLTFQLAVPELYVGLDFSLPLIRQARRRLGSARYRWLLADLADPALPIGGAGATFDLAVAVAVLHHLPTPGIRRAVVAALCEHLSPGGVLLLSFWDFSARPPHRRSAAGEPGMPPELAAARLEPGGTLLPWGRARDAWRYCHLSTAAEQEQLLAGLPLDPLAVVADRGKPGAANVVRLLRRR